MAPVIPGRDNELRRLLSSMNLSPGVVDPQNALIPFARFDRLHFARLVILSDPTASDIAVYGVPIPDLPPTLAFFGDCDWSGDRLLEDLADRAASGLRQIFACCESFSVGVDLLQWMRRHGQSPIAAYVNTIGRTVRQIREEAALHDALAAYASAPARAVAIRDPRELHREFLLLYLPVFFWQLRRHETADPQIVPRPDTASRAEIARHEDYDTTNPYIVIGCLKPGLFRRLTTIVLLSVVDYGARHLFNRGHLARVKTIHFARWVFLNGQSQMFFASNYDGSLEAYMDDFINKVGWGLNLLFSNGVGYPKTSWLIQGGSDNEQKFEYYIFRHQIPVDVWYKAYPGLTGFDLLRNSLIRDGLTRSDMTDDEVREWLNLI